MAPAQLHALRFTYLDGGGQVVAQSGLVLQNACALAAVCGVATQHEEGAGAWKGVTGDGSRMVC